MRHAILPLTVALTLLAAPLHAGPRKPAPPNVGDGRVAWFDLTTSDLAASKAFYGELFGWRFEALEGTDLAVEIVSGGRGIGTLRKAEGKIGGFNGVVYVQVSDLEGHCRRAKELGGTVVPGFPFNLQNRPGAIALVVDPAGHPVGMYSRKPLAK